MEDKQIFRDIIYTQSGMQLDLYLPAEVTEPLPVIVWIHGGAWRMGDKEGNTGRKPPVDIMDQGYVFASINYRLSHEAIFPAQIHDCKAAIRWLRAHSKEYYIDPERIGVWGSSAGGHLAALLGTSIGISELEGSGGNPQYSSSVQAVCDFFGPNDFVRMSEMKGELEKESPESLVIGGPLLENADKVIQANPITYINKTSPPFLIVHGDSDVVVPLDQSQIFYEALLKADVEAGLYIVPNAGHGFEGASTEQLDEINRMVEDFFNGHLM
ncbi:MAG: alpha/beta hydrolase [Dehalococcoidales bacterium]